MVHDRKRVRTVIVLPRIVGSPWAARPRPVPTCALSTCALSTCTVPTCTVPTCTVPTSAVPMWTRVSVVRRLLVVVAVAAGGWLLGGAGHAHAESLPRPGVPGAVSSGAGPRALPAPAGVRTPVDAAEAAGLMNGMARRAHPERQVRRTPASAARSVTVPLTGSLRRTAGPATVPAAVPGVISHGRRAGRLAPDLRAARQAAPLHSSTVLGAPARVWRAIGDFASIGSWTAGRLPGLPWTPRPRVRAGAGTGERTGGRVPVRVAATGASKDGRAAAGTEVTFAWPDPGSRRAPVRRDNTLSTAGPALAAGAAACLSRARPGSHAPAVPMSVSSSGFGAPAVRTSGDEPAFSPD